MAHSSNLYHRQSTALFFLVAVFIACAISFFLFIMLGQKKVSSLPSSVRTDAYPMIPLSLDKALWKMYENSYGGYQIQYAPNDEIMSSVPGVGLVQADSIARNVSIGRIEITTMTSPLSEFEYKDWKKEEVTVSDGIPATYYTFSDSEQGVSKQFYIFHNKKTGKYIQYFLMNPDSNELESYQNILSTFQFLP